MGDNGQCRICSKMSSLRCSFCRVVYYCSKEHQKKDWKNHKPLCTKQKFEICKNNILGRHLVAIEQLKPDQILLKDKPLILGPRTPEIDSLNEPIYCFGCYKPVHKTDTTETDSECTSCGLPICSEPCSKNYWHKHYECRFFTETKFNQSETKEKESRRNQSDSSSSSTEILLYNKVTVIQSLLCFRTILMKYYFESDYTTLLTLQSNNEVREDLPNLEKTAKLFGDFKKLFSTAQHPSINSIDKPELHKLIGILATNGTEIQIGADIFLVGIYPTFSIMEHSCFPNTKVYFIPKESGSMSTIELYVRTNARIQPGDHLSTTYTNLLWNTEKRREELKKKRFFHCNCPRCNDPTELGSHFSSIKCQSPECLSQYSVPITKPDGGIHWQCQKCGKSINSCQIAKVDKRLAEMVSKLKPELNQYREMSRAMEELVHPNYYLNFIVNHSLVQLFGKDDETRNRKEVLDEKIRICNQLLAILKCIDPWLGNLHLFAAVIYFEMQSAILALAGGEGEDDFKILRNNPESVKLGKIYLQKCLDCFQHEYYDLPENKLKILAQKKMEYLNMITKHSHKK